MRMLFLSVIFFPSIVFATTQAAPLGIFCERILQPRPQFTEADYQNSFETSFIAQIPYKQFTEIFAQVYASAGACQSFKAETTAPQNYSLKLSTEKGFEVALKVSMGDTGLFTGLLLTGIERPSVQIGSWADLETALRDLDPQGDLSATLKTTDDRLHMSFEPAKVFAMGSTFKLYVLGALVTDIERGERHWQDELAIREDWKSFPSGKMQDLPDGSRASLLEYATNMISISDNTATDHLLHLLCREKVAAMMKPMGNSHAERNRPFLTTAEMIKLKWAVPAPMTERYAHGDVVTREDLLTEVAKVDRKSLGENGIALDKPVYIHEIEWFGSTEDTCNAMLWIGSRQNVELRQVISKNTPFLTAGGSSHWSFAGYKGGSEPGVISMTYLLETAFGQRACLSVSWNNPTKAVSDTAFFDIVGKTLKFVETQIP